MKFRIRHPQDLRIFATYGYDGPSGLGFYVHVHDAGYVAKYDGQHEYDPVLPLQGALDFLIEKGFFSRDDLEEALERLIYGRVRELPRRLQKPGRVAANFRRGAD